MTRGGPIVALGLALAVSASCDDPLRSWRLDAGRLVRIVGSVHNALGGVEHVLGVRSVAVNARCTGPDGVVLRRIETRAPDLVRLEETTPDGAVSTTVCRSDGGWRRTEGGWESVPPERCAEVRILAVHLQVLRFHLLQRDLEVGDEVEFAGESCLRLSGHDRSGQGVSVFLGESALPIGFRLEPPEPGGPGVTLDLSDWRDVGPVRLPFYTTITRNGRLWRCTFSDLELNTVDEDRFQVGG